MHVVFGIGNPGPEYEQTRHNLGFAVVEHLARAASRTLRRFRDLPAAGTGVWVGAEPVLLVEPLTYVNRCGPVLEAICRLERVPLERVLIVVDDLALPLGRLRLRKRGSDGGHNGLRSIVAALGTEEVPRLRLGVGPRPGGVGQSDYVLAPFPPRDRGRVARVVAHAALTAVVWAREGAEAAMAQANRRDLDRPRDGA
ncbi:MAG: aminoacyl-tRNA hydrolase [Planctomycetota bacterium]